MRSTTKWGMAGFLDLYMVRTRRFTDEDILGLNSCLSERSNWLIVSTVSCCFVPGTAKGRHGVRDHKLAFADAVMVGLSGHLDAAEKLVARADQIIKETQRLFETNVPGTFTGQKNTKKDVQQRIDLFDKMLTQVLA